MLVEKKSKTTECPGMGLVGKNSQDAVLSSSSSSTKVSILEQSVPADPAKKHWDESLKGSFVCFVKRGLSQKKKESKPRRIRAATREFCPVS